MKRPVCQADIMPQDGYAPVLFTVDRADRALVLVRRIVSDVVDGYRRLMDLQEEIEIARADSAERQRAQEELAHLVIRLQTCLEELEDVGVELRDFSRGVVDFPCLIDGRVAYLCWELGEPTVAYWHELGEGFAERQPVPAKAEHLAARP
jgi:hypothetical protein